MVEPVAVCVHIGVGRERGGRGWRGVHPMMCAADFCTLQAWRRSKSAEQVVGFDLLSENHSNNVYIRRSLEYSCTKLTFGIIYYM